LALVGLTPVALLLVVLLALSGCGGDEEPATEAPPSISIESASFKAGGAIPPTYTCEGKDLSPHLQWNEVPDEAKALALLVDDPDAGHYTHWVAFNIPPETTGASMGKPPSGALEGENSFGKVGYGGPCPPHGDDPHRYVFALYALRSKLDLKQGAKADEVREAIADQAIARGRLIGTFKRG
jgi:Raf kinase inhibitor-like YbhB/YbcL family protein